MAFVGLAHPVMAKRTVGDNGAVTYTNGFICGKAISLDITPNYAEGELYADNAQAEYDKQFTYADMTLGTSNLPIECESVIFNHTVTDAAGSNPKTVSFKASDEVSEIGFGVVLFSLVNGDAQYIACWMPRVKMTPAGGSYETKGDSITFASESLEGRAYAESNGEYKIHAVFETEDAAYAWIKTKAGIQ